ncbi:MAG: iron ABC transporter permease [Clostridia bacterium]|nr:iron ABC transporter permease [Clostridia bacterium]
MSKRKAKIIKAVAVYSAFILATLIIAFLSVWIGNSSAKVNFNQMFVGIFDGRNIVVNRLLDVRAPRTVIAMLTGACLAVAGVLLQSATRNELADASIVGVSSATYLAHLICGMFMSGIGLLFSPLIAAAFGLIVFCGIMFIAWNHGLKSNRIILVGAAVNALLMIVILTLCLMSGINASAKLMALTGSLGIPTGQEIIATAIFTGVGLLCSIILIPKCNVLALGDKIASGLGMNVTRMKFTLIAIAVLLCSVATKYLGITAFVGLLAPLIARKLLGSNHKHLIPLSAIAGALIVLTADFLGRCVINQPFSMPVGIITTIIGGVVFLIMLKRSFSNGHQSR